MLNGTFFLGTHQPHWLGTLPVSLFVSDRRLRQYRRLPRALAPWALDSGGFTELSTFGSWDNGPSPAEYVDRVRHYQLGVGKLQWAAPQDWMCEPWIIQQTGLSVAQHQRNTVNNYLQLRSLAPDLPIVPVLQGWAAKDYLSCALMYAASGVDLVREPTVGLGSVCRRQATGEAEDIIMRLADVGIRNLHGFGIKVLGLRRYGQMLVSADSMAWSYAARRHEPLSECTSHRNCANCPRYALEWRSRVLADRGTGAPEQLSLFDRVA